MFLQTLLTLSFTGNKVSPLKDIVSGPFMVLFYINIPMVESMEYERFFRSLIAASRKHIKSLLILGLSITSFPTATVDWSVKFVTE